MNLNYVVIIHHTKTQIMGSFEMLLLLFFVFVFVFVFDVLYFKKGVFLKEDLPNTVYVFFFVCFCFLRTVHYF